MEQQNSNFRWLVLVLLFIANFLNALSMLCIPPLFMEIADQIPLTKAQMGLIMGTAMLTGVLFGPLGGGISDRVGSRWGAGIWILIVGGGGAFRAFLESPTGLIVCMFLVGAGLSAFVPNIPKALSIWFPQEQLGFTNALCLAGGSLGGTVAMAISANFLSPALGGWRGVMLCTGGLSLFIGVIWMLLYRDPRVEESIEGKNHSLVENFKRVLKVKAVWLLSIFFGIHVLGMMPIITFLPISLQERGMERAGELVSILTGAIFIFGILEGIISDKLGMRKPFVLLGTVVGGLCATTFTTLSAGPLVIALIICGAGLGAVIPILFAMPAEMKEIGPELTATVIGFFLVVQGIGAFLGPIIAGKLMDITGSYLLSYMFMGTALILAAAFGLPVKDTGSKSR